MNEDDELQQLKYELSEKNSMLNSTSDRIWSVDRELRLRSCNETFFQASKAINGTGLKPGDKVLSPEFGEEAFTKWSTLYESALAGETIQDTMELEAVGKFYFIDLSLFPIYQKGNVVGVSCFSKDLAPQIEKIRAFKESEITYRQSLESELQEKYALINNTIDQIWSIDQNMKLRSFNDAFSWALEKAIGREIKVGEDVIPAEFEGEIVTLWQQYYERVLTGEIIKKIEHSEDFGDPIYFDISLYPIYQGDQIIGASCYSKDVTQETNAMIALRESEQRYRQYLERMTGGYIALDNEWRFLFLNKKGGEIFGKDPENMIGKIIWEEFPEAIGSNFHKAFHQARETGLFTQREEYFAPWERWFSTFIYPDKEGITVFFHDTTQKNITGKRLRERESLLARIYDSTSDNIVIFQVMENGGFVAISVNQNAKRLLENIGVNPQDCLNLELKKVFRDFVKIPIERSLEVEKHFQQAVDTKRSNTRNSSAEFGETVLHIETTFNPVLDEFGTVTHVLWVARDVTRQKVNERMIAESQQQLNLIYHATTEMMTLLSCEPDNRCVIQSVNPSFINMVHQSHPEFTQSDVEGAYLDILLPQTILIEGSSTYNSLKNQMHRSAKTKQTSRFELNNFVDNKVMTFETTITPIINDVGNTSHLLMVVYDLTDKMNDAEKTLIAVNKAVESERLRLAGELHDSLTQTLSVASINLKNLSYDFDPLKGQQKYQKAIQYLEEGIEESRSIAHRIMPKAIRDFGLIPSIGEIIETSRNLFEGKILFSYNREIRLNEEIELNIFRIVQQALSNAFMHAHAQTITIDLQIETSYIVLTVQDDGIGFDPEAYSQSYDGIGIRTMRSRAIQLMGVFQIESQVNQGTLITVKIPYSHKSVKNGK